MKLLHFTVNFQLFLVMLVIVACVLIVMPLVPIFSGELRADMAKKFLFKKEKKRPEPQYYY